MTMERPRSPKNSSSYRYADGQNSKSRALPSLDHHLLLSSASNNFLNSEVASVPDATELNDHHGPDTIIGSVKESRKCPGTDFGSGSQDVQSVQSGKVFDTQSSLPRFTSSLPVLGEVDDASSWLIASRLDHLGKDIAHSQPDLRGSCSRRFSTATTTSHESIPPIERGQAIGSADSPHATLLERELELKQDGDDVRNYVSMFDALVKSSVPRLGKVKRNLVRHNSMPEITGDKVSDISDDDLQPKRKGGSRKRKLRSERIVGRYRRPLRNEAAPAALRRHYTMPSMYQRQTDHTNSQPSKRLKSVPGPRSKTSSSSQKTSHVVEGRKAHGERPELSKDPLKMRPAAQQFLRGQVFFWLPNDEKLQGRKIRMLRAQEWGAERALKFTPSVTHLIVEENWDYKYALRQLDLSCLPEHVIVVNEKYPPGCLELGHLADPSASRFRVRGYQEAMDRQKEDSLPVRESAVDSIEEPFTRLSSTAAQELILESFHGVLQPRQTEDGLFQRLGDDTVDYEVADSQPENIPSSPSSPAPRRLLAKNRALAESFEIKPDRRNPPNSPVYPDEPHRVGKFKPEKQAPRKAFVPSWNTPPRKLRRTPPFAMEATPQVTPSIVDSSFTTTTPRTPGVKDLLDIAIDETRALPVTGYADFFSEDSSAVTDEDSEAHETEDRVDEDASSFQIPFQKTSRDTWQEAFLCMHKNDGRTLESGPNAHTIATLQEMLAHYDRIKDQWRVLGYRKAITALRSQKTPITSKAQAVKIRGIGSSLADKIEEIASTSRLRKLEHAREEPHNTIVELFTQIYGVGVRQAHQWINQGHTTLEDLKAHAELTESQRIGIEHYEDFQQRISRQEAASHLALMNKTLVEISWKLRVEIGGSYRRGSESCGDIDFIITTSDEFMPDHVLSGMVFDQLIPRLYEIGYLKATLASRSSNKGTKWHGAALLPDSEHTIWRRVDILLVPARELGAAMIYFTGNDIFNRSMRLLARRKGMRLNQRGLYSNVLRGTRGDKLTQGTLLEGRDERKIFEILEVPFREPSERVC